MLSTPNYPSEYSALEELCSKEKPSIAEVTGKKLFLDNDTLKIIGVLRFKVGNKGIDALILAKLDFAPKAALPKIDDADQDKCPYVLLRRDIKMDEGAKLKQGSKDPQNFVNGAHGCFALITVSYAGPRHTYFKSTGKRVYFKRTVT